MLRNVGWNRVSTRSVALCFDCFFKVIFESQTQLLKLPIRRTLTHPLASASYFSWPFASFTWPIKCHCMSLWPDSGMSDAAWCVKNWLSNLSNSETAHCTVPNCASKRSYKLKMAFDCLPLDQRITAMAYRTYSKQITLQKNCLKNHSRSYSRKIDRKNGRLLLKLEMLAGLDMVYGKH